MGRPLRWGTVEAAGAARLRAAAAHAILVSAAARVGAPLAGRLGARALGRIERGWAAMMRAALGIRLDVGGLGNVDAGERYVVAALHESVVDPVVVARLPLPLRWVVRDEIVGWPDIGPYLRASPHIAVRPERAVGALRRVLRAGEAAAAAGASLAIFPQGTLLGIETRFARGAAVAAAHLGMPLLPVVVTGTHRVWGHPVTPRLRFGQEVGLRVLPPIAPADALERWRDVESAMKREALGGGLPAPRRYEPDRDGWWDGYRYEIDPAFAELADRVAAHRRQVRGGSPKIARGPSPAA